jgi:hypothetical protein
MVQTLIAEGCSDRRQGACCASILMATEKSRILAVNARCVVRHPIQETAHALFGDLFTVMPSR